MGTSMSTRTRVRDMGRNTRTLCLPFRLAFRKPMIDKHLMIERFPIQKSLDRLGRVIDDLVRACDSGSDLLVCARSCRASSCFGRCFGPCRPSTDPMQRRSSEVTWVAERVSIVLCRPLASLLEQASLFALWESLDFCVESKWSSYPSVVAGQR